MKKIFCLDILKMVIGFVNVHTPSVISVKKKPISSMVIDMEGE